MHLTKLASRIALAVALLLVPTSAEASFLDSLGNLWTSGTQKLGELFTAGKEKVGSMLGGDKPTNSSSTPSLPALLTQIEAAQEAVGGKADNVSGYLDRLGPTGPGAASRPFLAERVRDLETSRRTLDQLYGQLQPTLAASRGGKTLSTEEQARLGQIQRQQQILVASVQKIDGQVNRFEIASQTSPSQETDLRADPVNTGTDGPVQTAPAATTAPAAPPAPATQVPEPVASSETPSSQDLPVRPEAPAEEPPPPPTVTEEVAPTTVATATEGTPASSTSSWGSYGSSGTTETTPESTEGTIIKSDSVEAFGGPVDTPAEAEDTEDVVIKSDSAEAMGGVVEDHTGEQSESQTAEGEQETEYGGASRPASEEEQATGTAATDSADTGVPEVAAAPADTEKVFHPDDPEMGPWIDEWLAATGLDEYGRYVSPSNISARGSSDTGGLSRRNWVYGRVKDWNAGSNMTLAAYIQAKLKGESPAIVRNTDPFGGPLGGGTGTTTPRTARGSRDLPAASSASGSGSQVGNRSTQIGMDDASYRRLMGALQTGDQQAIREAYPAQ